MHLGEAFRMAGESIRAHALRSALTLLGIVIGVFAVIAAVTAVEVIDVYFNESLQLFGSSTFSVERYATEMTGSSGGSYRSPITYAQASQLKDRTSSDLSVSVLSTFDAGERARAASRETEPNLMLYGGDEFFLENFGFELNEGRPFTDQDVQYARPVALLGAPVASTLFPNESAVGKEVSIGQVRLRVVGVLAEKGGFLGYSPDERVVMPITHGLATYGDGGRDMSDLSVRAPSPQQLTAAQEEVIGLMRTIRRVAPGEANNFSIETNESVRGQLDAFTQTLTIGGAAIGLIALLAAGIGVMNIMLVSVTERTREIGIRKAVGARRWDVMRQFLLEAVVLCQIGGILGLTAGVGFGNLVAVFFGISAAIPWGWAIASVLAMTGIALVFGGYPAWKAARLDPVAALSYE